jgi:glycosyltransferase involved in cell wall biosynthesis
MDKPNIIVFRNQPIKISETFIYNQSVQLNYYKANILGVKLPKGPHIQVDSCMMKLINTGGMKGLILEILFKLCGYLPEKIVNWSLSLKPKILHAHFGIDGAMIMPLAKRLNVPFIVSFLGTDATMKDKYARRSYLRRRLYLLRRKKLARMVTKIIVPSKFLREKVVMEQGFPREKVHIIHHGVDLSKFDDTNASPDFGHILFVGRLIPRKGLDYLISALNIVKKEFPEITLTVIGDGTHRETYERQADQELGNGFSFLGFRPQEVVQKYMASADIFSMPSIEMPTGEAETFGLVFIEAHAMKLPVVSFNSGAIAEVVEHGKTGLLCNSGDIIALANNIKALLNDRQLRNAMGNQARLRVENLFDLQKQNRELELFYDKEITKSRK